MVFGARPQKTSRSPRDDTSSEGSRYDGVDVGYKELHFGCDRHRNVRGWVVA